MDNTENNIINTLTEQFSLKRSQVEGAVRLIDDGNTIPFIARYRKEATGSLSDEILRELYEKLNYLRNLESKKQETIRLIDEQGLLTDDIRTSIENASTLSEIEDIYRPFRPIMHGK